MSNLLHKIILVFLYLTPLLVLGQDTSISEHPFYVEVESSFTKKGVEQTLNFTNNLGREIRLTYEGKQNISLEYNGRQVNYGDSFILPAKEDFQLNIVFGKVPSNDKSCFLFRSDAKVNNKDTVSICLNQFEISPKQFLNNDSIIIDLSKSAVDSATVYLPYGGGTTTTVSVFKTVNGKKPIKEISYGWGEEKERSIVFKKKDKGEYFIYLVSCHSIGGRIWLNIE